MSVAGSLKRIQKQFRQMEKYCEHFDAAHEEVSKWSVGTHLEHLVITGEAVHQIWTSRDSTKDFPRQKLTFLGWLVLTTGYIVRGFGKAPEVVVPKHCSREELEPRLAELKECYQSLVEQTREIEGSNVVQKHPAFGLLSFRTWLRLVWVHQSHHLKIIRDILRTQRV